MTTATATRAAGIPPPKGRMRSDRSQAVVPRAQRDFARIHVVLLWKTQDRQNRSKSELNLQFSCL